MIREVLFVHFLFRGANSSPWWFRWLVWWCLAAAPKRFPQTIHLSFPNKKPEKSEKSVRPAHSETFILLGAIVFNEERMWCATLNYFLSLQTISHNKRLKSDAWHGNALLSCGPHKLVPQQKLSEFNGELVARDLKVSIFGVFFFGVVKIGK